MTIDFWGLGLQAINVLILIWLLSRVFWRPVAAAITKRKEAVETLIETAQATKDEADDALAKVTSERAGIDAERTDILDAAMEQAAAATKATLAETSTKIEAMLATAKATICQSGAIARKANEKQASDLSLKIARRLLERLDGPVVQAAFLSQLLDTIAEMPSADRAALVKNKNGIEIVTTTDNCAKWAKIEKAVRAALGGSPDLRFVTDPDLIAGLELRSPHFVLHNSWRSDLMQVQKAVKHAA